MVVLTSGEAIHHLSGLLDATSNSWLCQKTWLVIHPRLVDIAQQVGCNNDIIISDGPGDEQIMQCLQEWGMQKTKV